MLRKWCGLKCGVNAASKPVPSEEGAGLTVHDVCVCRWTWKMWALYLAPFLIFLLLYHIYVTEWYRWRRGYYHIHQAVDDLCSSDIRVRWAALDMVCNVCASPLGCFVFSQGEISYALTLACSTSCVDSSRNIIAIPCPHSRPRPVIRDIVGTSNSLLTLSGRVYCCTSVNKSALRTVSCLLQLVPAADVNQTGMKMQ